jgi:hypothetical protein
LLAASSRAPALVSGQYPKKGTGLLCDRIEKNERWAMRLSVASFPVAQRSEADAERRGELFLRQPGLFPHLLDIHLFGDEKPHACFLPFSVSDGLFQPALYAFK